MFNKTLKTYEDGSELTVGGLAIAVGAGAALATSYIVITEAIDRRKTRRFYEKLRKHNEEVLTETI